MKYRNRWRFKTDLSLLRDLRTNALEQVIKPHWESEELETACALAPGQADFCVPEVPFEDEESSGTPTLIGGSWQPLHLHYWQIGAHHRASVSRVGLGR